MSHSRIGDLTTNCTRWADIVCVCERARRGCELGGAREGKGEKRPNSACDYLRPSKGFPFIENIFNHILERDLAPKQLLKEN